MVQVLPDSTDSGHASGPLQSVTVTDSVPLPYTHGSIHAVFRFGVLPVVTVLIKPCQSAPQVCHPAFFAHPRAIYLILVGSHPPRHRSTRLLPRASRSHMPRSQRLRLRVRRTEALRAPRPTRTDALRLMRCFPASPPPIASHHLGWSWECVRGPGPAASAALVRRSRHQLRLEPRAPLRHTGTHRLPSLVPSVQRLGRERLHRVSVSGPIFGSNAECAFPLHLQVSDSALLRLLQRVACRRLPNRLARIRRG
jgi:hypothetical protein